MDNESITSQSGQSSKTAGNKHTRLIVLGVVLAVGVIIFAGGFIYGYFRGFIDSKTAVQTHAELDAFLKAAMEDIKLYDKDEIWYAWEVLMEEQNRSDEKIGKLFDEWDGEDIKTLDSIIAEYASQKEQLEKSSGPPDADWYRQGLIKNADDTIKAYTMLKEAIVKGSDKLARESEKLEEQTIKDLDELNKKYDVWWEENN